MAKPPEVSLPREVLEAAGAYRLYMSKAADLSPVFGDGAAVAASVRAGAAYEPGQLARGAVAYAAVVALQDPSFVHAVRAQASDHARRKQLVAEIWRDPTVASRFHGADRAAGLIVTAVSDEGARLRGVGARIKQAAYDVQRQPWSKDEVLDRDKRLAEAKTLSAAMAPGAPADLERLERAVLGVAPLRVLDAASPIYSPVVQRGLAVAALAALGEAGEDEADALRDLLTEPECAYCLKMAKLNLFQCLAVAKPWYEDIYCLGQHGVKDTGDCLAETTSPSWRPAAVPVALRPRSPEQEMRGRPVWETISPVGPSTSWSSTQEAWRRPDAWTRF